MKELSLNILDISENSVKAKATLVEILITESDTELELKIVDNGTGMTPEVLASAQNPFYTTRTTRKVGMGIPLLKMAAELADGALSIESTHISCDSERHGTAVTATFRKDHIDFTPLGDTVSTVVTLIQGHPATDFVFIHKMPKCEVSLDTRELRAVLEDVPLDTFEVLGWIRDSLTEQYQSI